MKTAPMAENGCAVMECKGKMVRPEGFEPPTNGFGSHYSIRLSYGRILGPPHHRRAGVGIAAP